MISSPALQVGLGLGFRPPPEELPDPVSFSLEEVLRRVRRTNKSSAGGLSGSNYKTMQAWFYQSDSLAENLTTLFNRIAAGRVPASIIPFSQLGEAWPYETVRNRATASGGREHHSAFRWVSGAGSEISGDHQVFLGTEAAAVRSGPSWWMRAHGCSYLRPALRRCWLG